MTARGDGWTIRPDGSIVYDTAPLRELVASPYRQGPHSADGRPLESVVALAALVAIVAVIGAVIMSGRLLKVRQLELMLALARQAGARTAG